uniref:Uncharacterized protein n=1 Tax=Picea glauca TaxID=3330 RepID=A0A101M4S3_PICGL|nr:hypothetical protein ABT39_MTgene664 [Picea glauca]QHR87007.1 hypothetical protein Q903MT_gene1016 [Picea sitchensis]
MLFPLLYGLFLFSFGNSLFCFLCSSTFCSLAILAKGRSMKRSRRCLYRIGCLMYSIRDMVSCYLHHFCRVLCTRCRRWNGMGWHETKTLPFFFLLPKD